MGGTTTKASIIEEGEMLRANEYEVGSPVSVSSRLMRGNGYVLRDVGSLNGTYVNRERVDEATLRHGDELQIGRYRLSFVLGDHGGGGA